MNIWTMIVLVTAIGIIGEVYKHRISVNRKDSEAFHNDAIKRIARLEDRMANIETIVLERAREERFSGLHEV
jgi:hypothetical protein